MPDRRLKLLVVIVDISAGTGTFCKNLGSGLKSLFGNEIEASLLLMRSRPLTPEEQQAYERIYTAGAPVHSDWRRWYETPLGIFRLRRALRSIEYDLIFTIGTYANVLVSMVAGPDQTIMSEHMNMSLRLQATPFGPVMRRLMRWRYPKSLIVAAARGITRDLEENFGATRTQIIPNGLGADRVRALAEADPGELPTPCPYNVAVGRLTPQKDYPTLLRAHAAARQQGLAEHLVLVGDGELRPELEALAASLMITESVHFLGHRSNPYPLMKRARCLILSSIFEGFAYVPIEAMVLGLPVIATDCPSGPSDILGDGRFGLLVPPADPQQLAAAMLKLCNSPTTHEYYSQQSRIRADELSVERMVQAYHELFMEEVKRQQPSP